MFRKTNPQQKLFGVDSNLGRGLRSRLTASWAEVFREEVLPILLRSEVKFSILYDIIGRPNFSVGRTLGILVLQAWHNLSDQDALDAFGFDLRWRYALDVTEEEAYLTRRTLVEFRRRLVAADPEMTLMHDIFEEISETAIDKIGLSVSEQRLDSTHIKSDIRSRGRLGLFQDMIHLFLKSLDKTDYARVPAQIREWHEHESNGWFGLDKKERQAKLIQLAGYLHKLIELFSKDDEVKSSEAYQLLVRLFQEQCELKKKESDGDDSRSEGAKEKPSITIEVAEDSEDNLTPAESASEEPPAVIDDIEADKDSEDNLTPAESASEEPPAVIDDIEADKDSEGDTGPAEAAGGEQATGIEIALKPNKAIKGDTLQSAYDPDASYGHKGSGYSVHITETCNNPDSPEIITDYEVHGAARSDVGKVPDVLDRLENTRMMPDTLYADGGYLSVPSTPKILDKGVEILSPVNRGPLGDEVMGRDRFEFDSDGTVTCCPAGYAPIDHRILSNNTTDKTLHAIFDGDQCRQCSNLEQCAVRAPNHRKKGCSPRETRGDFRLEITAALLLRDTMFAEQQKDEWKERYKIRSGVEATMSEVKRLGMGRLRVRGLSRVLCAVACKVIACNIKRWARARLAADGGPSSVPGALWTLKYFLYALVWRILSRNNRNRSKFAIITKNTYIGI